MTGEFSFLAFLVCATCRRRYSRGGGPFKRASEHEQFIAVDHVSFEVTQGETFAVVGESGCGKTTLARMLLRLIEPDGGQIVFAGRDLLALTATELRAQRREMQMIFQDPFASLDPRMRVGEIVGEPLAIHEPKLSKAERASRTLAILERVGLQPDALRRYPARIFRRPAAKNRNCARADSAAQIDCGRRAGFCAGRFRGRAGVAAIKRITVGI